MGKIVTNSTSNKKHTVSIRDHSAESRLFSYRAIISFIFVLLLFGILLANLYHLQIASYDNYHTRSNQNRIKLLPIAPIRGLIFDRNGTLLAGNHTIYQLDVVPDNIHDLDEQLAQLKQVIELTEDELVAFAKERKKIRRFQTVTLKQSLTEAQIARFSLHQYRFPDFEITAYQKRFYPYGSAAAHVLGYVSRINDKDITWLTNNNQLKEYSNTQSIGKQGIERYYEYLLHGKQGYEQVEVNSRGRVIRSLNEEQPLAGQDIYLTIDIELQRYIEQLLDGRKAAIIVSDPRNGEILAMVSSPSYDPNLFVNGISTKDYVQLRDDPARPLFNRTTLGTYPPASTVKPFVAMAALTEQTISAETTIQDPGWWRLPTNKNRGPCSKADLNQGCYRDWNRWGRQGTVNLVQALEFSSDTFFYQVAYLLGINNLSRWMQAFGYGKPTGIDLFEEAKGLMPTREWKQASLHIPWYQGDTISIGIGQGYWLATPIQMNKVLMALINNGQSKTPHLLRYSQVDQQKFPYVEMANSQMENTNPDHWRLVKQGMYNVIYGNLGSGHRAFENVPYKAAGKSGTAQVFGLNKSNYNANKLPEHLHDHALFIAYAPFDKPTIAISIILENGGGGGKNAAPIARKIFDYLLLPNHGITPPMPMMNNHQ